METQKQEFHLVIDIITHQFIGWSFYPISQKQVDKMVDDYNYGIRNTYIPKANSLTCAIQTFYGE